MSVIGQFWQKVTPAQLKRILAALMALVLVSAAAALVTQQGGGAAQSGGGWQSPASVFAARSPGRRNDGLVFWVKERLAGTSPTRALGPSRERVLPTRRAGPPAPMRSQPDAPFGLLGQPGAISMAAPSEMLGFAPPIAAFTAPGFDGLFDLPPPPSLSQRDEGPPLPPSPAVPELATWLQMVVAIATTGLVMRRARDVGFSGSDNRSASQAAAQGIQVLYHEPAEGRPGSRSGSTTERVSVVRHPHPGKPRRDVSSEVEGRRELSGDGRSWNGCRVAAL